MTNSAEQDYPGAIAELITGDKELPLDEGVPDTDVTNALQEFEFAAAVAPLQVADPEMARACHSGLWLLHNFLDDSHVISQNIEFKAFTEDGRSQNTNWAPPPVVATEAERAVSKVNPE